MAKSNVTIGNGPSRCGRHAHRVIWCPNAIRGFFISLLGVALGVYVEELRAGEVLQVDPMDEIHVVDAKVTHIEANPNNIACFTAILQVSKVFCGSCVHNGTTFQVRIDVGAGSRASDSLLNVPEIGETGVWKIIEYGSENQPTSWWTDEVSRNANSFPFPAQRGVSEPSEVDNAVTVAKALGQVRDTKPEKRSALLAEMVHGENVQIAVVMVHLFAQLKPDGYLDAIKRWTHDATFSIPAQVAADGELMASPAWSLSEARRRMLFHWMRSEVSERDAAAISHGLWAAMSQFKIPPNGKGGKRILDGHLYLDLLREGLGNPAFKSNGVKYLASLLDSVPQLVDDRSAGFEFLKKTMESGTEKKLLMGCALGIGHYAPMSRDEAVVIRKILKEVNDPAVADALRRALSE